MLRLMTLFDADDIFEDDCVIDAVFGGDDDDVVILNNGSTQN